jgi:hypothetical protein
MWNYFLSVLDEKQAAVAAKRLRKAALKESNTRRAALQNGIAATGSTFSGYQLSPPPVMTIPAIEFSHIEARLGLGETINIFECLPPKDRAADTSKQPSADQLGTTGISRWEVR